jgi:glycosyltransferase involved in cell wall biosynthesis
MRILLVVPSLIKGGAERLVLDIAEQLTLRGHAVQVAVLRDDNRYPELASKSNVSNVRSSVYYSVFGKDRIQIEGYEALVSSFKPDVIHSHLVDAELVSRHNPRKGVAYITHWHGCPSLTNPIPAEEWLTKDALWKWNTKRILQRNYRKCQNHFLCISGFIQQYVIERLKAHERETTVLHNAIDLHLFAKSDVRKPEGFRLISIGSLQKNKNHVFQFKVMRHLLDQGYTDIYLDIFGEGPELEFLRAKVDELGIGSHVTLHGIVHDIQNRINQAHLLVHSAWHEPFGLILMEAMSCGVPVLSFNTGGPRELVADGVNGFLTHRDDLNAYTDRLLTLYRDRNLLEKMGKAGIAHAQQFGLPNYVAKLEAMYLNRLSVIRK